MLIPIVCQLRWIGIHLLSQCRVQPAAIHSAWIASRRLSATLPNVPSTVHHYEQTTLNLLMLSFEMCVLSGDAAQLLCPTNTQFSLSTNYSSSARISIKGAWKRRNVTQSQSTHETYADMHPFHVRHPSAVASPYGKIWLPTNSLATAAQLNAPLASRVYRSPMQRSGLPTIRRLTLGLTIVLVSR